MNSIGQISKISRHAEHCTCSDQPALEAIADWHALVVLARAEEGHRCGYARARDCEQISEESKTPNFDRLIASS